MSTGYAVLGHGGVDNVIQMPRNGAAPHADQLEQHRGQLRFAERFTHTYDGDLLHAHGIGWHEWDGARWAECKDGAPTRAVVQLIKDAYRELPDMEEGPRNRLMKDIARVESAAGKNGVLELAQDMHPCTIAAERLDEDRTLFNTQTGTIRLLTGDVYPPRPADRISKVTDAAFNPDARSEVFDAFLERAQPDPEMRAYLARSLGSAMLGIVREQVLFIWHGEGANGKGTLRDAIKHALGDYVVEVPAELLIASRHGAQGMAPDRMRLRAARFAFCSEIDKGARMDTATMKKLTGGDPVNAKLLYRNPIEFDPSHQLFMLTNHLPAVPADDPAVWRRIQAVPWSVVVPAEDRDPELPEKLKDARDAILAWIYQGWLDYQLQGLNPPRAVLEATRRYQEDSDLLTRFLAEETGQVVIGHGTVRSSELYRRFTQWAAADGEATDMTNKAFTTAMEKRGFTNKRTRVGVAWQNMMLVELDDEAH